MAKLTLEQRIAKTEDAIAKEELAIEESKEKIKTLKAELKRLQTEQEQSFAAGILKLMKEKGISQDALLSQLEQTAAEVISSPNATTISSPSYSTFENAPDNE